MSKYETISQVSNWLSSIKLNIHILFHIMIITKL